MIKKLALWIITTTILFGISLYSAINLYLAGKYISAGIVALVAFSTGFGLVSILVSIILVGFDIYLDE